MAKDKEVAPAVGIFTQWQCLCYVVYVMLILTSILYFTRITLFYVDYHVSPTIDREGVMR
jgi:hypothetical protein